MKRSMGATVAVSFTAICLSGCASIVSGTSQEIKVVTNLPGANCQFIREGNNSLFRWRELQAALDPNVQPLFPNWSFPSWQHR